MTSSDQVLVQPTTTYLEGAEMKHGASEPYPVSRSYGLELQVQGFATIIEPETEKPAAEVALAVSAEPRKRGRPPKAR